MIATSRFLGPADKALWVLAIPMILSNITVPLLGLVDTAVIGHLDNSVYLAGVAIGAMISSFLFMLLLFLRMTTTGLTAQALGAKNEFLLARSFIQPFIIAVLAGLCIIIFSQPLIALSFKLIGASDEVLVQAALFLNIRWLSAPATLANMVILGWLLGVQYIRGPVILLIVGNLINILLDVILVMVFDFKVEGAAAATATAEYVTLALGLFFVYRTMKRHGISLSLLSQSWKGNIRQLLALNRDIMLRSLLLQLCFASLTVLGARMGNDVVAVNAILMNLLTFTAYALDGFAYAVEAHSGKAFGAKDNAGLIRVWHAACRQAGIVAITFSLIYLCFGQQIIACLTSIEALQQLAHHYLPWQSILPLLGVWCYLLDGMFIGATRGSDMRNSMAIAAIGYGVTLLALPTLGNHGLWLALTVFLSLRGLSLYLIWRRHWRKGTWFATA